MTSDQPVPCHMSSRVCTASNRYVSHGWKSVASRSSPGEQARNGINLWYNTKFIHMPRIYIVVFKVKRIRKSDNWRRQIVSIN